MHTYSYKVYSLQILRLISADGSVSCSWRVSCCTACQAEAPQKEPIRKIYQLKMCESCIR